MNLEKLIDLKKKLMNLKKDHALGKTHIFEKEFVKF